MRHCDFQLVGCWILKKQSNIFSSFALGYSLITGVGLRQIDSRILSPEIWVYSRTMKNWFETCSLVANHMNYVQILRNKGEEAFCVEEKKAGGLL